jgi:hypothetical protein
MPFLVACPSCGHQMSLNRNSSGAQARCPACDRVFEAGNSGVTVTPPPALEHSLGAETLAWVEAADPEDGDPSSTARPNHSIDREELEPCPSCREDIPADASCCPHCGEKLDWQEEEDDRPWERPWEGGRRDSEPHRGGLILTLGIVSLVCSPLFACCMPLGAVASVAGLSLGITALVLGRRDQEKMQTQLMDPRGRGLTQGGKVCGIVGICLNGVGLLAGLALAGFYSYMLMSTKRLTPPPAPPPPPPAQKVSRKDVLPCRLADYLPTSPC